MTDAWNSFSATLNDEICPANFSLLLQALWVEAKGNWSLAHSMIDSLASADAALVHAFFHRIEGDLSNADYWYRRAGRKRPSITFTEERKILVDYLFPL